MRPLSVSVSALPAAIPATWVAWPECSGSNGFDACRQVAPGGGNDRATITFAVVYAVWPFGKPSGISYPDGSKNWCRWSTPSSMIPIFVPAPALASVAPWRLRARIVAASRPCQNAVRGRRKDLANPGQPAEAWQVACGEDDRDAVRDDPVAPAQLGGRQLPVKRRREATLLGIDPARCRGAAAEGERRRTEGDDHLRSRACRCAAVRLAARERARHAGDDQQEGGEQRARHVGIETPATDGRSAGISMRMIGGYPCIPAGRGTPRGTPGVLTMPAFVFTAGYCGFARLGRGTVVDLGGQGGHR